MSNKIKTIQRCGCGCGERALCSCGCCGRRLNSGCECPDDADADHQLTWAMVTIAEANSKILRLEFELRMFKKYKHLDLEKLETDYDYYDCVFMEHFEMNYHNDETTEKHRLEGVEFMKMFEKPENPDDEW